MKVFFAIAAFFFEILKKVLINKKTRLNKQTGFCRKLRNLVAYAASSFSSFTIAASSSISSTAASSRAKRPSADS